MKRLLSIVSILFLLIFTGCTDKKVYTIGGVAEGIHGDVVLQNRGIDDLTVSTDGKFTFGIPFVKGLAYSVTILSMPTTQNCSLKNATGVVSEHNVTDILLVCEDKEPISNQPPVAKAGADQSVGEGDLVVLDGSASTDPDGTIVSYTWTEGSTVLGTTISISKADFSVNTHTISLTVVDDDGASGSDEVEVTVTASGNTKPEAHGQIYTLETCDTNPNEITLGAYDADGDTLTYHLVNTSNVTNGTVTIPDEEQNKAVFTMTDAQAESCQDNLPDSFTFKVNDGMEDSDEGGVTIDPPGVSCETDADCEVGQYCSEDGICRYET